MALPIFQTPTRELSMMQTAWASQLDPVLDAPLSGAIILKNIALASGTNSVPHLLARKLMGWAIVRQRASASVYDTQDSNQTPQLTLKLVSSAAVTVDLLVF